jgi:hypothetical protein
MKQNSRNVRGARDLCLREKLDRSLEGKRMLPNNRRYGMRDSRVAKYLLKNLMTHKTPETTQDAWRRCYPNQAPSYSPAPMGTSCVSILVASFRHDDLVDEHVVAISGVVNVHLRIFFDSRRFDHFSI